MFAIFSIKTNHPELSVLINFLEILVGDKKYRISPSESSELISQLRLVKGERKTLLFMLKDVPLIDNEGKEVSPEDVEELFSHGVITEVSLSLVEDMEHLPQDYAFWLCQNEISLFSLGKKYVKGEVSGAPEMVKSVEVNSERIILAGEKIWKVPVSWQTCGHYFVRAKTFEEAAKYIEKSKDIPLPADADFICSFKVDYEGKGIHNNEDYGTVDPIDTTTIYTATSGL